MMSMEQRESELRLFIMSAKYPRKFFERGWRYVCPLIVQNRKVVVMFGREVEVVLSLTD